MTLAPVIPSALFATWAASNQNWAGLFAFTLLFALLLTLLVGLPTFLLLRNLVAPRPVYAMLVGGLIPTLPFLLIRGSLASESVSSSDEIWGYGLLFALGAIGGFLFWAQVIGAYRVSEREIAEP